MAEKIMSLFFLIVSLSYTILAQELSMGTLRAPKAGFLPMLAGSIATLLALIIVTQNILQGKNQDSSGMDVRKLIFAVIGLLSYIVVFNIVGYFFATFMIMIYLLKVTDTPGWTMPFIVSAAVAIGCYLVFKYYLNVYLP